MPEIVYACSGALVIMTSAQNRNRPTNLLHHFSPTRGWAPTNDNLSEQKKASCIVPVFRRIRDDKHSGAPMTVAQTTPPHHFSPHGRAPANGILSGGRRRPKGCIVLVVSRHTRSLQALKSPNDTASSSFIPRPCLKVPTHSSSRSSFDIFTMGLVDTLGFCISVFGLVICLRFLLPHNMIPTIVNADRCGTISRP
ncbi:hypothetical protein EDB89DRAFT_283339 [Lactarius sanguifluus]|nr:hypothetical protein EDB89DRAFT_283339 [Lactarius sanguifluus]